MRTIRWLLKAWPLWSLIIVFTIHHVAVLSFPSSTETVHKLVALTCQIVGGILVLLSIDSNLGILRKDNLFGVFLGYLKRFPITKSPNTVTGSAKLTINIIAKANGRVIKNPPTIEGKLEYLQEQIDELREKNRISIDELSKGNESRFLALQDELYNIRTSVSLLQNNLDTVSVGGITLQVFGVLLVVYGSVTAYLL